MKKILPTLLVSGTLAFGVSTKLFSGETQTEVNELKNKVTKVLKEEVINQKDFDLLLNKELENNKNFTEEQKQEIKKILSDENFKSEFFSILKKEKNWSLHNIIISLLLGFAYGYAYLKTIKKIKNEYMKIEMESFLTFSLTSGGMVLLNGFLPGSFVYFESFILAGYSVYLNYINRKYGREPKHKFMDDFLNENPLPIVRYDKDGKPLEWNRKMEEETGYSYKEVLDYYNEVIEKIDEKGNKYKEKRGEVMTLLYKGENLNKVLQYLAIIKETNKSSNIGIFKGYKDITFTMTIKSGEEKTFLWTTLPDGNGGTLRTARFLIDDTEIKKELEKTKDLLRTDSLTGVLNKKALEEDFIKKTNDKRRKKSFTMAIFDLDNFKSINDKLGHNIGNIILKDLIDYIKSNIRDIDRIYRLHGDEFVILFDSDDIEGLIRKIDEIKLGFFNLTKKSNKFGKGISTSWGVTEIPILGDKIKTISLGEELEKVDKYMYAVKYFRLIKTELISRGITKENFVEKNAIAYPKFNDKGKLLGIEVIGFNGSFFLSNSDLDLIYIRLKNINDDNIRNFN